MIKVLAVMLARAVFLIICAAEASTRYRESAAGVLDCPDKLSRERAT
jgi:hypothetical protein